jgi:RND family efflux transporter MFP subunit
MGVPLVAAGCKQNLPNAQAPPPPKVTVAHPVMSPVQTYYLYNGHLEPTKAVDVRARVKGLLKEVKFVEGEEVQQGDPLYAIDEREFKTAVARAEADKAKAAADILNWKAQIKLAEAELNRLIRAPGGAVTQSDIDKARATVDVNAAQLAVSQAALDSAEAALHTAQIQLGYTDIRAEIGGRISRTLVTEGNLVGQDQPTLLTTIVSMDPIYVYFDAPERDLMQYQRLNQGKGGPEAAVEIGVGVEEGYPHRGRIDFQENRVDIGTGTVRLRGRLPNPPTGPGGTRVLYPGLYARIRVPAGPPESRPVIPEEAIGTGQEGRFVFVVGPGEVVEKRIVVVGTRIWQAPPPGSEAPPGWSMVNISAAPTDAGPAGPVRAPARSIVAIDKGLTAADRVIISGLQKARPGAPVAPEMWELKPPPAPK